MKTYQDTLGLDHDPFAPANKARSFFPGAGREALLHKLVEQAHYGAPLSAVSGALGAGKTTLAREFSNTFADEAVCVQVQATLFMNRMQFLEALLQQLPVGASSPEPEDIIADICQYAERLYLDAKTLVVVVDDAHELASEVLESIETIISKVSESALHFLLLGENQLSNMLHTVLGQDLLSRLIEEELAPLGGESALDYVTHKLREAGFAGPVPLDLSQLGGIVNETSGIPGAMNSLISTSLNDVGMRAPQKRTVSTSASSVLALGTPYWAAAAVLFALLLGALVLPEGGSTQVIADNSEQPVVANQAVASTTPSTQRIELPLPVQSISLPVSEQPQTEATMEPVVSVSEPPSLQPPAEEISKVDTLQVASANTEETQPEIVATSSASDFEQQLLASPGDHYTVQIMGSRSEDSVKRFVARELGALNHGYFETRYQNQPWYVVVMGEFVSREAANRALSDLPSTIRELDPWIRNLADIQSDIREVRGIN